MANIIDGKIQWSEPDALHDYIFDLPSGKYNAMIKLTDADIDMKTKVLCKEKYAQLAYDSYVRGSSISATKDLVVGDVYEVVAKSIDMNDKMVYCQEVKSKTLILVSYSEYKNTGYIESKEGKSFKVVLTKNKNGEMFGSIRKYQKVECFDVMGGFLSSNTCFDVKVVELIRGGFKVVYNNTLECFLPGALAAPNIIHDFEAYVGRTIPVMVDNFDKHSNLFVVSHKKYIKYEIPNRINDLVFGKMYTGVLTNNPSKAGIFVEFEGIFTGRVHTMEFDNYYQESAFYGKGDSINVYIKRINVTQDGEYRINLTIDREKVDVVNLQWQFYKDTLIGKSFDFTYDEKSESLRIIINSNDVLGICVPRESMPDGLGKINQVRITDVDVINKFVGFNFI